MASLVTDDNLRTSQSETALCIGDPKMILMLSSKHYMETTCNGKLIMQHYGKREASSASVLK